MDQTVESLCNQLARNRLLEPEAIRAMRGRWRAEAKDGADDAGRFSKWMIANGYLSDFQFGMLTRGFADLLFVGAYRLLDRIGQGRMAGVYKAVHPLGQVVAVKVLPPSKAKHPPLLARFQREARLALRLKHPNVVRTFEVGKTKGDINYLVMEFLDGETLEDVLARRQRLPVQEAVHVMLQALRGLQHLDEENMVHRDLKPANLMLTPPRARDQPDTVLQQTVKILDIGLGRALFDEGTPGTADLGDLTNEGALLGTPNYMAPEQARNAHTADIRSDIYSLGCVFYEMLTGQSPFPDNSFVRQMVRHATELVRPLRELNPGLPEALQPVLDMLLAKDPAQRYASPSQAGRAIKALAPQLPDVMPQPEPGPQLRTYLTWLETNRPEDGSTPLPALTPARMPAPIAVATAPTPQPTMQSAPGAPPPAPGAVPVAASVAGVAVPIARPVMPIVAPVPAGPLAPVSIVPAATPLWRALLRPNRRDVLFAMAGAAALLVFEFVVWLVLLPTR